jgi:septum formation inhibitor MinC
MEVQELTHQQERIAGALHELVGQLPELLAQVPADADYDPLRHDVNKFLQAVADAKIEELLSNAAKTLAEPDTQTGHALAQTAAAEMDKLIGKCNGLGDQAQQCSTAHFAPSCASPASARRCSRSWRH